ncbi:hypothetical protein HKD37_13G038030 [Glycine soja]|nr:hypothetical protein GmHk_13G038916 [Glycine max]
MGRDFSLGAYGDHEVEITPFTFGLIMALHVFGMILISLSIISMAIFSCGEYDNGSNKSRRSDDHDANTIGACCTEDYI